jgi:hypothetical protein
MSNESEAVLAKQEYVIEDNEPANLEEENRWLREKLLESLATIARLRFMLRSKGYDPVTGQLSLEAINWKEVE